MKRTRWIPLIVYAALLMAFLGWISNLFTTSQDTLPYSKVVELFNKEQVRQFVVQDQTITMQLNKPYNGQTTITAPLADPESFRQEMHETFAEQTASGVLESYNFVPDKGFFALYPDSSAAGGRPGNFVCLGAADGTHEQCRESHERLQQSPDGSGRSRRQESDL